MLCHYGNRAVAPIMIIPMVPTALDVLFSVWSVTSAIEEEVTIGEINEVVSTPQVETSEVVAR